MSVYVRIPRRPYTKPQFSWTKRLVEYAWEKGTCWYVDNRIHFYYWDKYSVTWDANGNPQKGDYIEQVVGYSDSDYPSNGVGSDASGNTVWYVFSYDAILGSDQSYWQYDWSSPETVTSTDRLLYPDSFTEYIPEYIGGGTTAMQPCYRYVGEGPGNTVGTVYSEDENAYPANGKHTDGYWYSKIS